jgi:hypothetical protein
MNDAQNTSLSLPCSCNPRGFLPAVQEAVALFQWPPYLFQDFVGKAIAFLQSHEVRQIGFELDPATALPCKWKCADESLFGVDLILYAYTGHYPFDKGKLGGRFNIESVGAAVHHSPVNLDFGGAHVGYMPGPNGGSFGSIQRPLRGSELSTDCGYLMGMLAPFKAAYDDACRNILFWSADNTRVLVSVPNEYLAVSWSSHRVKLLLDIEKIASTPVPRHANERHTRELAGRTLFYVSDAFLAGLTAEARAKLSTANPAPIGGELTGDHFHVFDSEAEASAPASILPYMDSILSSRVAPYPLEAAVTSCNIEHNRLTDTVRRDDLRPYAFASFSGVFIDMLDASTNAYVNLFQPIGISIKPAGHGREIEISPAEVHDIFDDLEPADPVHPLEEVLGYERPVHLLEQFTFPTGRLDPGTRSGA